MPGVTSRPRSSTTRVEGPAIRSASSPSAAIRSPRTATAVDRLPAATNTVPPRSKRSAGAAGRPGEDAHESAASAQSTTPREAPVEFRRAGIPRSVPGVHAMMSASAALSAAAGQIDCRPVHIRDPIHGAIEITPDERALVDSPQYQRLRNVKQLGFADLAFPGATHTRYAHGLGAMAVATKVFDALAPQLALEPTDPARFRQTLRLAVPFPDLAHAPLAHRTKAIIPKAAALRLPEWTQGGRPPAPRTQGNHPDYTPQP